MTAPLRPEDLPALTKSLIPDFVIEAVNGLLVKHAANRGTVVLHQDAVIAEILRLAPTATRAEVFAQRWLDFEDVFREAGWQVRYDKPGYNETYEAHFMFTPRRGDKR